MLEMMRPYYDKLEDGEEQRIAQLNDIAPNGLPEMQVFDLSNIVEAITAASQEEVDAALRKEENESQLCQALNEFRKQFDACSQSESFFNPQHLLEAVTVYDKKADIWHRNGDYNRCDLFFRQVYGYEQRYAPASYAQAFNNGIYHIVAQKELLQRTFKFRYGEDAYYPLVTGFSGLGFDWAATCRGRVGTLWSDAAEYGSIWFGKLCQTKTSALLGAYCRFHGSRAPSR